MGLLAGRFAAAEARGEDLAPPPETTAIGALIAHITGGADASTFQPMNVNFGLFPLITIERKEGEKRLKGKEKGKARKQAMSARALVDLQAWLK